MPNIGPVELIIILVIALIVIGPGRLPDVGAALGKSIREFRKASSDVQDAVKVDTSPMPATPPAPAAAAPGAVSPPAAVEAQPAPAEPAATVASAASSDTTPGPN